VPKSILPLALLVLWISNASAQPVGFLPDEFDPAGPRTARPLSTAPLYGFGTDWASRIDEAWGPSPWTPAQMLEAFDLFWGRVDAEFACFQGIDVDWSALRTRYRDEVAAGPSRGRFAAIMNHLSLALRESHTNVRDTGVNTGANLAPGVPLFALGPWGITRRFGAALTPMPDSSLLVYNAMSDHPLGLVPGDIVLGYEGIPWKRLYPELLAAELPMIGIWGSSPSSFTHTMLAGAGLNWHLFGTIDVVKYDSGDTLHLPVAPLAAATDTIDTLEQLPVPGVPMPRWGSDWVSWGIVENTNIGYVYVRAWTGDAGFEFANAIDSLLHYQHVSGLIFDFRTNFGGNMFLAYYGLNQLFANDVTTVTFAVRCGPGHEDLCPASYGTAPYVIHGNAPSDFAGKIAVLVGPYAVSSGDQVANLLRYHPRTRTFGKPTAGAFNAPSSTTMPLPGWIAPVATADAFNVSVPGEYLTHDEFPVDEPVWFTPASVARGYDDVVVAALRWIDPTYTATLLEHFTAVAGERSVELRWSFGVPERVAAVAIERGEDADGPWTELALEVRGADDGWTAIDAAVDAGVNYAYRLHVTWTDGGRSTFGPVFAGTSPLAGSTLAASPNPATGPLRIDFTVARAGPVRITVVDVAGRTVRRLRDGAAAAGVHALEWDGRGESGARAAAGVYFIRMVAPDRTLVRSVSWRAG
jgi:hypothetical protein